MLLHLKTNTFRLTLVYVIFKNPDLLKCICGINKFKIKTFLNEILVRLLFDDNMHLFFIYLLIFITISSWGWNRVGITAFPFRSEYKTNFLLLVFTRVKRENFCFVWFIFNNDVKTFKATDWNKRFWKHMLKEKI